ncbi:MAG TPA: ATP-binding protein, partial [Bacteroidales bacterium]|nr:ATP-binding protein [Bacteroidales bacterium]
HSAQRPADPQPDDRLPVRARPCHALLPPARPGLGGRGLADKIISPFYVTTYTDSAIWFGTTDGIFRYRNIFTKGYYNISSPIIRKVSTIDSVIYHGTDFSKIKNPKDTIIQVNRINPGKIIDMGTVLNYDNNSLTFQFAFPFYDEESKNLYSYYLEGFDKTWSEWTTETKREFINLSEGDYVFYVKAKNIYNIESAPTLFKFKILPPWYQSFAAILGYIIFGILFIIAIVRLYTYRLIREKDKLEKIVIQRTQEILIQKEEIIVQAEHLKDANERISAKNKELEKQKWEITNQALQLRKVNIELLKLSKVASETDNAIGIFDKYGNIEWVNNAFTKMYGYTLEQYKKEKYKNIKQSSDNPNINQAIDTCINESKSIVYEFKTKSREGKELWAQTTLTPVVDKDGKTINLIAIDSDITKLKLAEKEIIQQKQEIEQQRDKLAVSNATKNKFFRIIAHDLRNPISTLVTSTNVVFNDFDTYNREQTKNIIAQLNRLSQTTFNLLENLLDWSSTQTGEVIFNPKPVDIYFVIIENIELVKRKIDQKKIKLNTELPENLIAYADENMIKAVVRNLLSNAVKFTPEKGAIEILAKLFKDTISITVKDTGIGIDPKYLPKLFRIGQHHTTPGLSNEKGSGLGLILCKEFVEKNGGTITIDSIPGKGTSITFTLKKYQE